MLPKLFYEANINQYQNQARAWERTLKTNMYYEFTHNILHKILENIIKRSHTMTNGLFQGMQGRFKIQKSIIVIHNINRIKNKNHIIIS